ncbi:MAG: hypothetical protein V4548_02300 [Bacteroidota bacterium]
MRYYKPILILLTLNLVSCEKTTEKLFWISETTSERNDFLFLTESTNVVQLKNDSLKLFLRNKEFLQFDSTSTSYKNFGQIYKADKFRVFILLRSSETDRRDYAFLIRTFDPDWKIIDDFELGTWDEKKKKFCYGSIDKDLNIEKKCDNNDTPDIMQITDEGKIIMTSFHKK